MIQARLFFLLTVSLVVHGFLFFGLGVLARKWDQDWAQEQNRRKGQNFEFRVQVEIPQARERFSRSRPEKRNQNSTAGLKKMEDSSFDAVEGERFGIRAGYPRISRELGEQGTVTVRVQNANEGPLEVRIVEPLSGFPRLEQAAISAVQNAQNQGLLRKAFQNRSELNLKFVFRLKDVGEFQVSPNL